MGSALVHYGITDAITAGGMTLASWRRRAKNGVLRLLQVRQAPTIVLAVEHFDVFRRAILAASPPQSVWSFSLGADGLEAGFGPTSGLPNTHL